MARNFIQPGETLSLAAPSGGVVSGTGYLIGGLFGVALTTAAEGVTFEFKVTGVWQLAKTSAQAWVVGDKIYRNAATGAMDTDATTGPLVGVAVAVADNPSATGIVRLNGGAPSTAEGPQAAVASFTFGTNITAATANNALTDSSATNPTEAQFNELAKEVGTKVNDILVRLRAAGIIAT
jgi:predicted RecA/RadA family phage recombinase